MSYLGSQASITVTVQATPVPSIVSLWLQDIANNPNNDFSWGGNSITFIGSVDDQFGQDLPGVVVTISYGGVVLGTRTTDIFGSFSITAATPYQMNAGAYAQATCGGINSGQLMIPIYGKTRISGMAATPPTVELGQATVISGSLQVETAAAVWGPVQGQTVNIAGQGPTQIASGSGVTATDGSFSVQLTLNEVGSWTVTATFTGAAQLFGASGELIIGGVETIMPILFIVGLLGLVGYAVYKSGK